MTKSNPKNTLAFYLPLLSFICLLIGFSLTGFSQGDSNPLKTLNRISGKQTLFGMHNREPNNRPAAWTNEVFKVTGKYPALWSGDFLFQADNIANRQTMINEAIQQSAHGAIINIMWHACNPALTQPCAWDKKGVLSQLSNQQWQELLSNGSPINMRWKAMMDEVAAYLQQLKDKNIKVLFRPLHEMNQSVFWWGGRPGPEGTRKLYQLTHDYFVNTRGLTNLIWIWDIQDFPTLSKDVVDYNPGDKYWDVAALDIYDDQSGFSTEKYEVMVKAAGGKPIAIGECQKLPTAALLKTQPKWTFFMGWSELTFKFNTYAEIKTLTEATNVLTLDELKTELSVSIHVNQVGFDLAGPKFAVLELPKGTAAPLKFEIITASSAAKQVYSGKVQTGQTVSDWYRDKVFYNLDFSALRKTGNYKLKIFQGSRVYYSASFQIAPQGLAKMTIPSILHYYNKQRANTPEELAADRKISPKGSDKRVDMRGGWADASGDISKYFSHLAYANYMSPQQIPLVAWSLANTKEAIPSLLSDLGSQDSIEREALYGADYLMRSLTPEGYFYMIIFSHFNKDPAARDIVGLLANSVTTTDYQCAFREGGGMAIAALARISTWKKDGDFSAAAYLEGAKRAFAHLLLNNSKYTDDGKDNIIDDYCALMAATELRKATGEKLYRDEARKRAAALSQRLSPAGYFFANDTGRPFWHGADAGMPIIALARYLTIESDQGSRSAALATIKKALDYNLKVTANVSNPFGYARQTFLYRGQVKDGFFIPQENETGWWWQGENARLASLATAAIVGGKLVYPSANGIWGVTPAMASYASKQLSWILGGNPYDLCFMYGFGNSNVPYMAALFGHGSQKGGISNGITGKEGHGDGSGIDFKVHADGNEWRWTEQWIPHAAWFLQAVTAMSAPEAPMTKQVISPVIKELNKQLNKPVRFTILAIGEDGGHHVAYTKAARGWLNKLSLDSNFKVDYLTNPRSMTAAMLSQYQLVIQLDYPPYGWGTVAEAAFKDYVSAGKGGWIGFHHATLLGEFDGFPMWQWYADFMGGMRFKNYIPDFANGTVRVEDPKHPVMAGIPKKFLVEREEWYTYDRSPRLSKSITVLANVDEESYVPNGAVKMGDHPVVWSNTDMKARNVYIFMGHDPTLFENKAYLTLFKNAIFWAAYAKNGG